MSIYKIPFICYEKIHPSVKATLNGTALQHMDEGDIFDQGRKALYIHEKRRLKGAISHQGPLNL